MAKPVKAQPTRLVIGLGNPGKEHQATRHNAGFWLVESIAETTMSSLREEKKFLSRYARVNDGGEQIHLLCPNTYMNLSGQAVKAIIAYFDIAPAEILVVHDELDLPVGAAKLKFGGGHGGHNGLRNIIEHLHTKDFLRLRLGIGRPGKGDPYHYVLGTPSVHQRGEIMTAAETAYTVFPLLYKGQLDQAMLNLHTP